ncbi:hypothetical protein ABH916_002240 [Peribacillus frigoritolerans]
MIPHATIVRKLKKYRGLIGKYEQHLQFWILSKIGGAVFLPEFLIIFTRFWGMTGFITLGNYWFLGCIFYIITRLLICEMMEVINGIFWFLSILIFFDSEMIFSVNSE